MAKRTRTVADVERIRAGVRDSILHPPPPQELVEMKLSCGHTEAVTPGADPSKSICSQCHAASLQSKVLAQNKENQ